MDVNIATHARSAMPYFALLRGHYSITNYLLQMMSIFHHYYRIILICVSVLIVSSSAQAQFWAEKNKQLLPEDQAFAVTAQLDEAGTLKVYWSIANDYYMYRDQFAVESASTGIKIGQLSFPEGVIEDDPDFGEVVVYFFNAEITAVVTGSSEGGQLDLVLKGQGCNKPVGVCYPPMVRNVSVEFSAQSLSQNNSTNSITKPERSFSGYILSAFLAGILLSFTPCVLPMVPILAGIIAGQHNPGRLQSGWLAICYVAGTVLTYIAAGAIAGATGAQLQAYFQNVWVISAISVLLMLLAASLFGWYKIQLPSSLQSKLSGTRVSTRSAAITSFSLGLISALVVGACVSPILILALGAAITQGDPVLGAAIMGSMAIGMGWLLILFGFGAGWILPKAGAWMVQIQVLFGFMVLGVAIYLLSSLAFVPNLFLWAALLLSAGFYVWYLSKQFNGPMLASATKAASAALLVWGVLAVVGGSMNGTDILRPLEPLSMSQDYRKTGSAGQAELPFVKTTTLAEVKTLMQSAAQAGRPVMIDFYADWCLDCRRMQRTTYRQASIKAALQNWILIEIDVTETSAISEEVKRFFQVFGPPATLFFAADGEERNQLRQYGYLKEAELLALIDKAAN